MQLSYFHSRHWSKRRQTGAQLSPDWEDLPAAGLRTGPRPPSCLSASSNSLSSSSSSAVPSVRLEGFRAEPPCVEEPWGGCPFAPGMKFRICSHEYRVTARISARPSSDASYGLQ